MSRLPSTSTPLCIKVGDQQQHQQVSGVDFTSRRLAAGKAMCKSRSQDVYMTNQPINDIKFKSYISKC